jgi:hypothetical protein
MRRAAALVVVAIVVAALLLSGVFWSPIVATRSRGAKSASSGDEVVTLGQNPAHERKRAGAVSTGDDAAQTAAARVVRGVVVDADKKPIENAQVLLLRGDEDDLDMSSVPFDHPLATCRTDAAGAYAMDAPGGARVSVVARKEGFAPEVASVDSDGDIADIVLKPGERRELLVVDDHGKPVVGAEVYLSFKYTYWPRDRTSTDEHGRASIVGDAEAEALVRARGRATRRLRFKDSSRTDVNRIVLPEGRLVSGVVVDGDGSPLGGVRVALRGYGNAASDYPADGDRRTKHDGSFVFDGVDPDPSYPTWWIECECDGRASTRDVVVPGQTDVRIVMRRATTVRGVVAYEDGAPVKGAGISNLEAKTGEDGRFEIAGVGPGRLKIDASAPSPGDSPETAHGSVAIDVAEGVAVENVRITLALDPAESFVRVHVVDPDGSAVNRADVHAWIDGQPDDAASLETSGDGIAELRVGTAPGGSVVVTASLAPRSARTVTPATTGAWPPKETVELRLGPPGALRLRLVDSAGRDVALDSAEVVAGANSQPDGTYALRADEPFTATIYAPGYATHDVKFDPPQPPVREETVRLDSATRIVGRVLGADGKPVPVSAHVDADVTTKDGAEQSASPGVEDDGTFEIATLPAGRARLRVIDQEEVLIYREFDVAVGTPADVGELRIPERVPVRGVVTDGAGKPLPGAQISFADAGGTTAFPATTTRPDGSFDVLAPKGLGLRITVRRSPFATRLLEAEVGVADALRVVLGPAGAVRVRSAAVRDAGDRSVEASIPGGVGGAWSPHRRMDPVSSDTDCVYDDLPPGPVEITLVTVRRRLVRKAEVVVGQTADCVFGE